MRQLNGQIETTRKRSWRAFSESEQWQHEAFNLHRRPSYPTAQANQAMHRHHRAIHRV